MVKINGGYPHTEALMDAMISLGGHWTVAYVLHVKRGYCVGVV